MIIYRDTKKITLLLITWGRKSQDNGARKQKCDIWQRSLKAKPDWFETVSQISYRISTSRVTKDVWRLIRHNGTWFWGACTAQNYHHPFKIMFQAKTLAVSDVRVRTQLLKTNFPAFVLRVESTRGGGLIRKSRCSFKSIFDTNGKKPQKLHLPTLHLKIG